MQNSSKHISTFSNQDAYRNSGGKSSIVIKEEIRSNSILLHPQHKWFLNNKIHQKPFLYKFPHFPQLPPFRN